jgi:uncharacterized protein YpiB (UPF0302 family)
MSWRPLASAVAVLSALSTPTAALAQSPPANTPAAKAQADYQPSMGDLMTMTIQPRHIKLHFAGEQQNWSYAAYELGELRNAFARIARTIPRYHALDTASITTAVTQAPLDAIDQAIKARNPSQFTVAYAQLTQACNACHQSLGHSTVVIKVPTAAMFPDQQF